MNKNKKNDGGGSVVRSGLLDKVKKYLDEAGIAHVELGGIQPNPTDPKVYYPPER